MSTHLLEIGYSILTISGAALIGAAYIALELYFDYRKTKNDLRRYSK